MNGTEVRAEVHQALQDFFSPPAIGEPIEFPEEEEEEDFEIPEEQKVFSFKIPNHSKIYLGIPEQQKIKSEPQLTLFQISDHTAESYHKFEQVLQGEKTNTTTLTREVFEVGEYHKNKDSEYHADEKTLERIVQNFRDLKDRIKVPLKLTHDHTGAAFGWVSDLRKKGKKLIADFKYVPQKIHDLIEKTKNFPRVSIELHKYFEGKEDVMTAVSFLGEELPEVDTLNDLLDLYHKGEEEPVELDYENELELDNEEEMVELVFSKSEQKEVETEKKDYKTSLLKKMPSWREKNG